MITQTLDLKLVVLTLSRKCRLIHSIPIFQLEIQLTPVIVLFILRYQTTQLQREFPFDSTAISTLIQMQHKKVICPERSSRSPKLHVRQEE
jgi:hypothetical protein